MFWLIFIFYAVVGIIMGAIFALLFIQMDKRWKTCVFSAVSLPSFLGVLYQLNSYMHISNDNEWFYLTSALYVIFLLITISIVMCITGYLIKKQAGIVRIRFLDILLGYTKSLEQYYTSRKDEVDKDLNYETLKQLKQEQEELKISNREKERIINDQLNDAIVMSLPLNSRVPIDNRFLSCIPGYTKNLLHFYHSIVSNTKMFCDNYKKDDIGDIEFFLAYLSSICIDINTKLFNDSASHIRTHFRVKNNDNYIKFIAFQGSNKFCNDLTKIPIDLGLIKPSFENRCSLIKSENRTLHHRGNNDGLWKNYISFAIYDICKDGYPLLSIGISISDEALYNDMLYFINFCQIERIISECISQINEVCNIYKVVECFCEEMERK